MNHRTRMVLMVGLAVVAVAQAITGFGGGWVLYVLVGGYAWMTFLMMRGTKGHPRDSAQERAQIGRRHGRV